MTELYFAQVREDPLVELSLMASDRPRSVVTIASGGCTALSLLTDEVERVVAVDLNPFQTALVELRRAALGALDRDAYLRFVGEQHCERRLATYRALAAELSAPARALWDARTELVQAGVQHAGVTERFYRFVGGNLRHSVCDEAVWRELLTASDIDSQQALAENHFRGPRWETALRVLLSKTSHLAFFPAFMFEQAAEHDFGAFFDAQFARELRCKPLCGNYFLSQLLYGSYLLDQPGGTPPYLSVDGYQQARRNLQKLEIVCAPLGQWLANARNIDAFFLSNVFDWADAERREQIASAVVTAGHPGSRVLFRHMLARPTLPPTFQARLELCPDSTESLLRHERSMSYRAICSGKLR